MLSSLCSLLFSLVAVCEHAYSLAQNLDPNSEGRGVLQFKTGLMSVIKVSLIRFQGEKEIICTFLYTYTIISLSEKLVSYVTCPYPTATTFFDIHL